MGNEDANPPHQQVDRHEDCPEFFTAPFIAETWGRMTPQYNMCVTEGIHYILGQYDDGVTFEKMKRFALTTGPNGGTAWRFAPAFDFYSPEGFWKTAFLPGIQQERQRQDIQSLVDSRAKGINQPPGWRRKGKMGDGRNGGNDWGQFTWQTRYGGEVTKPAYPTGPALSSMGKKMCYAHRPLDRDGKASCYGLGSHSGCSRKGNCTFSHQSRIKADGSHWASEYEIARRGGLTSSKRIEPQAADGYLQDLREIFCRDQENDSRRQDWDWEESEIATMVE